MEHKLLAQVARGRQTMPPKRKTSQEPETGPKLTACSLLQDCLLAITI